MKLVFVPQSNSDNFTTPVPSGEYKVIAFDLESETIPRLPISVAADSENIVVTSVSDIQGTPSPPPSSENITVTVLSSEDIQVTCPQPLNCLVLIQSLTSLNTLHVRFIKSFITSTIFSLDTVSNDSYVVVYSWDSEQSIFDGKVSLISSLPTITPTSVSPTNPPPGTVSQAPLPTEAIAGISVVGIMLLILIVCVGTTVIVMVRIRKQQHKVDVPEGDGTVDWSSTLAGIEQPNEAYAISAMMKKNIAYEETKIAGAQKQRMDDSPVLTVSEGGEYENIQPVHQYEEVLPQSLTNTAQYVNVDL